MLVFLLCNWIWNRKPSPATQKQKKAENGNNGGKVLGIPAGQFQKTGGLGREKIDFGKNKCIKRRRGNTHKKWKNKAQNFLQSTETQVWLGRKKEKLKKKKTTKTQTKLKSDKKRCQTAERTFQRTFFSFCFYIANPKPSQSRIFPPTHKKHTSVSQVPVSLSLYHLNRASWTPHWNKKADLDEVLFLFFGVVLSSFCIDYSCVCVCCVIGSFGFMSEVCTWKMKG